jgi:hypothetical protein
MAIDNTAYRAGVALLDGRAVPKCVIAIEQVIIVTNGGILDLSFLLQ